MSNEAQCRIDDEITRLNSSLCDLRSQRNTLSLISRLPTEVLADIFVLGASDYYYQENHPRSNSGAPDWVNISYVCRHWRNVALDCPTLWTYVIVSSQGFTEVLLARSKRGSLKICIETDKPLEEWSRLLHTVLADHAERIQELRFLHGTASCPTSPLILFSRITRLQVLEVDAQFYQVGWGIIHGVIPTLRRLKACNCSIPWDSFQPSGLTSLSLVNIHEDHRLDIVELQSYLGCMHDLVHLHLWNALRGNHRFLASLDFDPTRKLALPHLSRLLIAAPLSTILALLSYIKIPSKTKMNLQCYDELAEDEHYLYNENDCSSLYLLLQQLCPSGDQELFRPTIRTFSIRYSDRELLFSSSERYGHRPPSQYEPEVFWDCDIPLQIGFKFVPRKQEPEDFILSNMCRSVSSKDVRSAQICSLKRLSTFWKKSLGHFQEVRHLRVTNSNIADLASALSLTSRDDAENQDGHVGQDLLCAPALEELECISCWIGVEQDKADQDISGLRKALSIRKERGRALKRLVIKDNAKHTFPPKDVLDLPVSEVLLLC